jgi:hypothetical protein
MAKAKSSKGADKKAAQATLLEAQALIKNQIKSAQDCDASTILAPFLNVDRKGTPKMTIMPADEKGGGLLAEAAALLEKNELPGTLAAATVGGGNNGVSFKKKSLGALEDAKFLMALDASDSAPADAENVDPKAGSAGALLGFVQYRCAALW